MASHFRGSMIRGDRSLNGDYPHGTTIDEMGELAAIHAGVGIDSYSDYGVGAALSVRYDFDGITHNDFEYMVYGGCNINLSGMEVKIHAEQMALFQALIDMRMLELQEYASLERIVVVTSEDDMALRCGHCFQVLYGACEFLGTDPADLEYIAMKGKSTMTEYGPDGVHWTEDRYTLEELFPESYTGRREENV